MITIVKRLPKDAVYDYTGVFGEKIYHTKTRRYEVYKRIQFGRMKVSIYSKKIEDENY